MPAGAKVPDSTAIVLYHFNDVWLFPSKLGIETPGWQTNILSQAVPVFAKLLQHPKMNIVKVLISFDHQSMFLLELCYTFLSHSGSCLDYKQHNCWKQFSNPGKISFLPFWFQMHCVQFTAQCTVCNCMEINGRHLTLGGDGCRSPAAPHRHPRQGTYMN